MLKVNKELITVDLSCGSDSVIENIKENTLHKNIYEILVCDTKHTVVFCSPSEISRAIENLPTGLINEFNENYSINKDICDCIEADCLMEDICFNVLLLLNINYIKYFSHLQDYCEKELIEMYRKKEENVYN